MPELTGTLSLLPGRLRRAAGAVQEVIAGGEYAMTQTRLQELIRSVTGVSDGGRVPADVEQLLGKAVAELRSARNAAADRGTKPQALGAARRAHAHLQSATSALDAYSKKTLVIKAAKSVGVKADQPATVINVTRYLRDLNAKIAQGSTYKYGGAANILQREVDRMRGEVSGIGGAADYIDRTIRLLRDVETIMADKRIPIEVRESQANGVLRRVARRYTLTMQYIQAALGN